MKLPIPSILHMALVAFGLLTATACNDSPPGTSGGSSESGDSSTTAGPSVPPVSSSGLDSTSTDPSSSSSGSSSGSTDAGASTDASSGSAGSSSDSGSTSSGSSSDSGTTGSSSDSEGSSESGTTGGGSGYCNYPCAAAADCAQPGTDPADWSCTAGFCEFVGMIPPCDPVSCPIAAGFMCAPVDGIDVCVMSCTPVGNECDAFGLECSGVTDMGDSICVSPPCGGALEGDPCVVQGFGQVGICTGGVCTCTDDSECTGPGLACTA